MSADSRYTPEQQTAIYDNGGSLLVSAAAGSGKTTVLVQRAMRIICDGENPVPADSLFIITFTNAAAAELKSRLMQSLDEKMRSSGENGDFLRKQKLLLARADIGTVDSFCKRIVLENFNKLDIPADINIAPESKLYELRCAAMSEVMEEMYTDADFAAFMGMLGKSRTDKAAEDLIWRLYGFLGSMPFEDKALEDMQKPYSEQLAPEKTAWGRVLLSWAYNAAKRAEACIESALKIINDEPSLGKHYDMFCEDAEAIGNVRGTLKLTLDGVKSFDDAINCVSAVQFKRLNTEKNEEETAREQIKALRKAAKDQIEAIKDRVFVCSQKEFAEDAALLKPGVAALCRAVKRFSQEYYRLKISEKAFDFSDFEHLALRLLCDENKNRTPYAKELAKKYSVIMVDEYQDTNDLQNLIYECLANEDKSNMFFVGDIKQSIYRFRQANPEIFLARRQSYTEYNGKSYPATVTLKDNFRSTTGVINTVNDIFSAVMSVGAGDVEYNEKEKLYSGTGAQIENGESEIHFVASEDGKDAEYTAKLINDILCGDKIKVRSQNGLRRPVPEDICILLRSPKSIKNDYALALQRYGIPAYAGGEGSFLQLAELQPLIAALRVVDNPLLDVPMSAALLSPMFGYTPQRLTELRLANQGKSLYSALASGDEKDAAFLKKLSDWGVFASSAPIYELCGKIIAETYYKAAVGAMPMGRTRCENLRRFCEYAKSYTGSGLSGFLRMLDNSLASGVSDGEAAKTAPPGYVNIMSIHASKGLEFPICIVAGLYKRFNQEDTKGQVLLHPRLGIGVNIRKNSSAVYRTIMHEAVARKIKEETLSEEMRVLYVALTRARDKLIMINSQDSLGPYIDKKCLAVKSGGVDAFLMQGAAAMGDWITYAALMHTESNQLWEMGALPAPNERRSEGNLKIVVAAAPKQEEKAEEKEFSFEEKADDEIAEIIAAGFEKSEPLPQTTPIKYSVSQLVHGNENAPTVLSRPSFMYKSGLSSAEAGTAMHAFLQYADFAAARRDINAEIRRLTDGQFISLHIAESLPRDGIESFLNSTLCDEMLAADRLLREYEFITEVGAETAGLAEETAEKVIVQGVADCIIIKNGKAKLVDYKTDKGKTEQDFKTAYAMQLKLYRTAVEKRLKIPVKQCVIYSMQLKKEIVTENT